MPTLDESTVDGYAPNADAAKNGRKLVSTRKLAGLGSSADGDVIWGNCQGSGKEPYHCSADFARPAQPTFRCTCPSRQLPCKHCLGLMYAFAQKHPFPVGDVPADLQAKREKLAGRAEKKAAESDKPKQVNAAALAKKINAQLAGIDTLERLTLDLVRLGVGNMNAKIAGEMEKQAGQLGDAYLPGARAALQRYTKLFERDGAAPSPAETERLHTEAVDELCRLHGTVKQGRAYLRKRLDDPNLAVPTDTAIAAWLGHAWQLSELKACGRVEPDAELLQLAFNSHDDAAREQFTDTGVWITLGNGHVRVTQTLRPYKAAKFIKSEDSFYQVACVPELCVYPGGMNPRVRWDAMTPRPATAKDYEALRNLARPDFASAVKDVKNSLKGLLADKAPILALHFAQIGRVGGDYVAEDAKGERLVLTDAGAAEEPPSCHLLPLLPASALRDQVLVARFRHDFDARTLCIKPLSIVTPAGVLRLTL